MQADLGWSLVSARREQARLIVMSKLCHSLVNVNSSKSTSQLPAQRAFSIHIHDIGDSNRGEGPGCHHR